MAESEQPALETKTAELVCTGANCMCGPIFGIGFVQGTDGLGQHKNFELAVPHTNGGFSHYWRDNNSQNTTLHLDEHTWHGSITAGSGDINGLAMLENTVPVSPTIPGNGNLEVMAMRSGSLYHYWRDRATKAWTSLSGASGTLVASGVIGQPGFTQSKASHKNFEVVVARAPAQGGGLAHYYRDNTNPAFPWSGPTVFATGRNYDAVALIESDYAPNRLEVIARSGNTLYHVWREGTTQWTTPREIISDTTGAIAAIGVHSFIQRPSPAQGVRGNFELVVPMASGGLRHFYRDNASTPDPWPHWHTAGSWVDQTRPYSAAGLTWTSFGRALNAVGRRSDDGALAAFSYSDADNTWMLKGNDSSGSPLWSGAVFGGEPCCHPATHGLWQNPYNSGAIGIHAALLRTGKVLFFGFGDDSQVGYSEVFDPKDGSIISPTGAMPHAFCAGHAFLNDGRLWVAGGHNNDVVASHVFDPEYSTWTRLADMGNINDDFGRWYPTLARLSNGSVLAISGTVRSGRIWPATKPASGVYEKPVNSSYQIMNTALSLGSNIGVPDPFAGADPYPIQLYPFVFQLPSGHLFVHSYRTSKLLDVTTGYWATSEYTTQYAYSRNYPGSGSAVLLPLSASDNFRTRIMMFGGGGPVVPVTSDGRSDPADVGIPATNTVEMLDFGAAPFPQWVYKAPMNYPRVLNTAVLLPTGKVFVVGGSTHGSSDHAVTPVMTPEMYDPSNDTWTKLCPMRVARLYHTTALLLPDARVLTAGRDHDFQALPYKWPERRVEIYTPPYLLSGNPRPAIQAVDDPTLLHDQTFQVTLSADVAATNIASVVLMSPGAVTHGFDQSQRAVNLTVSNRFGNTLNVRAPLNGMVAPPGYYMLFVVSNQGVPSIATFIKLG